MDRSNHYEAAFEAYLRSKRVAFVPVDEAKRAELGGQNTKSLDFIVVGPDSAKLVVDVKGRRFPGGKPDSPRFVWQNWSTQDDVAGLTRWAAQFGPEFRGVLAFVYRIEPPFAVPADTPDRFAHRDHNYLMRAVDVATYQLHMKPRSPRWGTVHLPTADFRRVVRPFSDFLARRDTVETPRRPRSSRT